MSAEAVQWAWRVECGRLSDKLVLLRLAWKADGDGAVRVDPVLVSGVTGLSLSRVGTAIAVVYSGCWSVRLLLGGVL